MTSSIAQFRKAHSFERTFSLPTDLHILGAPEPLTHSLSFVGSEDEERTENVSTSLLPALEFAFGNDAFLHSGNEFYSNMLTHSSDEDDEPFKQLSK